MENNNNSSVSINLREGSVTISGSESFIEKNMEAAFDFVERNFSLNSGVLPTFSADQALMSVPEASSSVNPSLDTYTNGTIQVTDDNDKYIKAGVYHIDSEDGTISILKKIPGNSKAEKTKNIALIVLFIRNGKVPGKEIVPICEKHACYDSSNFSSVFKGEKTNIIRKGSGQNWTIELTQPGREAAIALLEEMANDTK